MFPFIPFYYYWSNYKYGHEAYFIYFDITSNVGIHEGYVHLNNKFINDDIHTPIFNNFIFKWIEFHEVNRKQSFFTIVLAVIAILISGRRILWLSFIIPIFYYSLKYDKRDKGEI